MLSQARAALRANPTQRDIADILRRLEDEAKRVETDAVVTPVFAEEDVHVTTPPAPPITRSDVELGLEALAVLTGSPRASRTRQRGVWRLVGLGSKYERITLDPAELESDTKVMPITIPGPVAEGIARELPLASRMPLVLGECADGPYRAIEVRWVGDGRVQPIESAGELDGLIKEWLEHPEPVAPALVTQAEQEAVAAARQRVYRATQDAERIERSALERQVQAAQRRLLRELARTLRCFGDRDLEAILRGRIAAEGADQAGLYHRVLRRLDKFPEWPPEVVTDAGKFVQQLSEDNRTARLAGSEVNAALDDPRWKAKDALKAWG